MGAGKDAGVVTPREGGLMAQNVKVSLVVGHTSLSPGAWAVEPVGMYEYKFNTALAEHLSTMLGPEFETTIYFRDNMTIREAYHYISLWKPDMSMELHFNAATDPNAYGTETLCAPRSAAFAGVIQEAMCKGLGRDKGNRGVKTLIAPEERGFSSVYSLKCPNILIEPFFGSNTRDCELMLKNLERFCVCLVDGVKYYLTLS